jgi:hypothetical protein
MKCFFYINNDPTIGYLIPHDAGVRREHRLERMKEAYDLARHLQSKYQIKHLLLEPPVKLMSPPPLCIQEQLSNSSNFEQVQTPIIIQFNNFSNFGYQKNLVMPDPSIILKPWTFKYEGKEVWYEFVQNNVVNGTQFMKQFKLDAQRSVEILKKFPRLVYDYQVLVDKDGNLYHLDLDRAFEDKKVSSEKKTRKVLNSIDAMVHEFQQAIERHGKQ